MGDRQANEIPRIAGRWIQRSIGSPLAVGSEWIGSGCNEGTMDTHRILKMPFASAYPHYVQKAEKKGRTKQDVDEVICWLTGYSPSALARQIREKKDFDAFFGEAPSLHPNASKITGVICGVRIEEIEDPLMRKIRY